MSEADTGLDKLIPVFPQLKRVVASHRKFERQNWKSREIYDVNCKKTIFRDCDFSYSEFDLGYFHSAEFRDCKFVGARFNNCNFQSAKFFACDFSWAQFSKCQISVKEILATLPSSPNIRQDVLRSLKANAIEMCDREGLSLLTLQEIETSKRHYNYALRGTETYYKHKYSTFGSKLGAGYRYLSIIVAGLVWGHGEKPFQLLVSCFILLLLLSFINFWGVLPRVSWTEAEEAGRIVEYVFRLFLDMPTNKKFAGFEAIDYIIVTMRYIYIGLFISILHKSIARR